MERGCKKMCEIMDKLILEAQEKKLAAQIAAAQAEKLPKDTIIKVLCISENEYEKLLQDYNDTVC